MTREEAVALLERYSNYEGLGIPNLAGCKEAMKVAAEALKEAYPELAESEDERIRRWLCDYFGSIDKAWIHKDITCIDILRWLEKQKEQKHPNGCFTCDEYKKGYEEGRRNGFTAGYNKAMKEVEQKEQKPVVTHGETYHVDTLGTQQVIAGKMPQKPAEWSEEDKRKLNRIYSIVGWAMDEHAFSSCKKLLGDKEGVELQDFLRSIAKPKQEWSEEDEDNLCRVIRVLEDNDSDWKELSNWLKSLRPSWKPSEGHLSALLAVFNDPNNIGSQTCQLALTDLYEQLKKL